MPPYPPPHLLTFSQIGDAAIGYLSVSENVAPPLPFVVQRVYWTYDTPDNILRGRHAHRATEHVLLAAVGSIVVTLEHANGRLEVFRLESPHIGLYVPPNVWHTMQYAAGTVQLALASQPFAEEDYIREYSEFKKIWASSVEKS